MKLIIKGELIDYNAYEHQNRGCKYSGADTKKDEMEGIYCDCLEQHLKPIKTPVFVEFHWYCKDRRKDKDNICFAKKFILDGLVLAGVLENDGWKQIAGFSDSFYIDKKYPRIEVVIKGVKVRRQKHIANNLNPADEV